MSAEGIVLGPEGCSQLRFLVRQDKYVKAQPDECPIPKKAEVAEEQALASDHRYNRNVHRVSDMTVEPTNHKVTRRENGCWRTQPPKREPGKRVQHDGNACNDEEDSDDANKRKIQERRVNAPARHPPRHETRNCPGGDDKKEHRSENGEHSPRATSAVAG